MTVIPGAMVIIGLRGVTVLAGLTSAIRDVLRRQRNARVVLGEVIDVDLDGRIVTSRALGRDTRLPYDSLIVATGSAQSYFGHDEFAVHAPGLKSIDDALEVRLKRPMRHRRGGNRRGDQGLHTGLEGGMDDGANDALLRVGQWVRTHLASPVEEPGWATG